jgi:LacI family transcriptional regulator
MIKAKYSILDVAARAKVSRMTVTRVLRSDSSVRPTTRTRVMKVMQQLGYIPSPAARALRSKDSLRGTGALCLALVFGSDTQVADGFFCDVARGAEQEAAANGLCLLQVHGQDTFEASWPRLQAVFSIAGLCGVILAGEFSQPEIDAIHKHTEHVVLLDRPAPCRVPVASVEADNVAGCKLALEHLLERGCRRLLVLTGQKDHYFTQAMREAAEMYRPRFSALDIVHGNLTAEFGKDAVRQLWTDGKGYDGIFGNDEAAIGAMRALADLKVSIPDDIKIVGFDDIPHAQYITPTLTSISIDKHQLGREGVKTLMELIREPRQADEIKKVIRARLVIRESTGG